MFPAKAGIHRVPIIGMSRQSVYCIQNDTSLYVKGFNLSRIFLTNG